MNAYEVEELVRMLFLVDNRFRQLAFGIIIVIKNKRFASIKFKDQHGQGQNASATEQKKKRRWDIFDVEDFTLRGTARTTMSTIPGSRQHLSNDLMIYGHELRKKLLHKMHSRRAEIAKNFIASIRLYIGIAYIKLVQTVTTTDQRSTRVHAILCGVTFVRTVDRTNANETGTVPRLPQSTAKRKRDLYLCT